MLNYVGSFSNSQNHFLCWSKFQEEKIEFKNTLLKHTVLQFVPLTDLNIHSFNLDTSLMSLLLYWSPIRQQMFRKRQNNLGRKITFLLPSKSPSCESLIWFLVFALLFLPTLRIQSQQQLCRYKMVHLLVGFKYIKNIYEKFMKVLSAIL